MKFKHGQYVRYKGICYRYENDFSRDSRLTLSKLRENSDCLYAEPARVKPCSAADIDGIEYFLSGKDQLNIPYHPDMINRPSPAGDSSQE